MHGDYSGLLYGIKHHGRITVLRLWNLARQVKVVGQRHKGHEPKITTGAE